jgi:hypothetical protein
MALTKFVRNVDDLSDDGGYKFRFRCDGCGDGYETQYSAASANMLKTAIEVFSVLRPFGLGGYGARRVTDGIDRGLRGKERDAAYERAVNEAQSHFKKCTACGKWVCPDHCWNPEAGMCERCAPEAGEAAGKRAAQLRAQRAVEQVDAGGAAPAAATCPGCGAESRGSKFCEGCGMSLDAQRCKHCQQSIGAGARFCGHCGGAQA